MLMADGKKTYLVTVFACKGHFESSTRLESFNSRIEWMNGIMVSLNSFSFPADKDHTVAVV